jgi:peroxiredoxin
MGIIRSHFVIDAQGLIEDVQFKVSPTDSISRAMAKLSK